MTASRMPTNTTQSLPIQVNLRVRGEEKHYFEMLKDQYLSYAPLPAMASHPVGLRTWCEKPRRSLDIVLDLLWQVQVCYFCECVMRAQRDAKLCMRAPSISLASMLFALHLCLECSAEVLVPLRCSCQHLASHSKKETVPTRMPGEEQPPAFKLPNRPHHEHTAHRRSNACLPTWRRSEESCEEAMSFHTGVRRKKRWYGA
jgi:hypothetical protein